MHFSCIQNLNIAVSLFDHSLTCLCKHYNQDFPGPEKTTIEYSSFAYRILIKANVIAPICKNQKMVSAIMMTGEWK